MNFDGLVQVIERAHSSFASQATKAVNISLTLRNWFIGHHFAEYELQGQDRASYGERLLEQLAAQLAQTGLKRLDARELRRYRLIYSSYPQIRESLTPVLASPPNGPSPRLLLERLSFTHFAELLQIDAPLKRLFYEVETLRGNWSVSELKRQIATQCFAAWRASTWRPLTRQIRRPRYIGGTDIHHRLR